MPRKVDREDLEGAAFLGLAEAIMNHDGGEGLFDAYAMIRARGAVHDELRSRDLLSRTERAKVRQVETAHSKLTARLGRPPTDTELVRESGCSAELCAIVLWQASGKGPPRREMCVATFSDPCLSHDVTSPEKLLLERRRLQGLRNAIERLPARLREVVNMHYVEGLTLREIAERWGVSAARISQLQKLAVEQLRTSVDSSYRPPPRRPCR
jgi:RNA polymerase sigma factor for flagellar operon FliA